MKEPVRILSDLHLGHQISRIAEVATMRPLVAGAGTVVFNGDTWQELAEPFRERSESMLGELRELCAEEGADVVFLPGNHDPGWPGPGWIELAEGRVVVTHGDALLWDGSPWKREVLGAGHRVAGLWKEYPEADTDPAVRIELARAVARELCSVEYPTGRTFLQRAWDAAVPPTRALRMIESWFTQGESGAQYCDRYFPRAEILVIGHFHHAGCWRRNGRTVVDTGSFMNPGRADWMEWRDGLLVHGLVDESTDEFRLGKRLGVWRFPEEIVPA